MSVVLVAEVCLLLPPRDSGDSLTTVPQEVGASHSDVRPRHVPSHNNSSLKIL